MANQRSTDYSGSKDGFSRKGPPTPKGKGLGKSEPGRKQGQRGGGQSAVGGYAKRIVPKGYRGAF